MPVRNDLVRDAAGIPLLRTITDNEDNSDILESRRSLVLNPDDLIGKTFLCEREDDGTIHRAEVIERIHTADDMADQYLVKFGADRAEVLNYNTVIDSLNKQVDLEVNDPESIYSFKAIQHHRKKGYSYEVLVGWECGETTWELIALMRHDDQVTLAKYAKENDILNQDVKD